MSNDSPRIVGSTAPVDHPPHSPAIVALCDELKSKLSLAKQKVQESRTISTQLSHQIHQIDGSHSPKTLHGGFQSLRNCHEETLEHMIRIELVLRERSGQSALEPPLELPLSSNANLALSDTSESPSESHLDSNEHLAEPDDSEPSFGPHLASNENLAEPDNPHSYSSIQRWVADSTLADSERPFPTPERDEEQQRRDELVRSIETKICEWIVTYEELKRTYLDKNQIRKAEEADLVLTRLHHYHDEINQAAAGAVEFTQLLEKAIRDSEQEKSNFGVKRRFEGVNFTDLADEQRNKKRRTSSVIG